MHGSIIPTDELPRAKVKSDRSVKTTLGKTRLEFLKTIFIMRPPIACRSAPRTHAPVVSVVPFRPPFSPEGRRCAVRTPESRRIGVSSLRPSAAPRTLRRPRLPRARAGRLRRENRRHRCRARHHLAIPGDDAHRSRRRRQAAATAKAAADVVQAPGRAKRPDGMPRRCWAMPTNSRNSTSGPAPRR